MLRVKRAFEVQKPFTKIPNEFLDDSRIWKYPAVARAYMLLLSLHSSRSFEGGKEELAASLKLTTRNLDAVLSKLKMLGMIEGGIRDGYIELLPMFEQGPLEEPEPEPHQEPEKLIIAEIEEQPKRQSTGLSQKDRWELIKQAWNKHKPESYLRLDGSLSLPVLIAIETQTKRLDLDRDDYDGFIGAVLRGAGADDWWNTKDMTPAKVFGFGANLDDKKFFNVEKLYKSGLAIERKEQRGAANVEAIRRRQEEEFRQMDEVEAAQEESAKRLSAEYDEINAAWDKTKKEGWAPCNRDPMVCMAVKFARGRLEVTESYEEFLRKCFAGYINEQLTPRQFADAKMIHSPQWQKAPLVDSYIWYQKENA